MEFCCVAGCNKNSQNSTDNFYQFPTDFDLCMLWVQTCGKAEYFEDFAYGGALPFLSRRVCSSHFLSSDFVDPNRRSLGLQAGVAPIAHFEAADIVIKREICEDGTGGNFERDEFETIKDEPDFYNNEEDGGDELIRRQDDAGSLAESSFRSTWSQALRNVETRDRNKSSPTRIPHETEKQRKSRCKKQARRMMLKRANESPQERKDRMYKDAVRTALRRSLETEEQRRQRKFKNALRAARRRSNETPEQKAERRRKDTLRSAQRRKEETELQTKIRKYNDAVRAAFRRKNETPDQRQQRRMIDVLRAARRRSTETVVQRQARLKADRERAARRRLLKKIGGIGQLDASSYLGPTVDDFNLNLIKTEFENSVADAMANRYSFIDNGVIKDEEIDAGQSELVWHL